MTEGGLDVDVWECGGGCAIGDDLLENRDEVNDVGENGGNVTSSDVTDGLLDDWESVGDIGDALWVDVVEVEVLLVAGAIGNGLLDELDELGKVSDDLGEVSALEVIDELWDEVDELSDVVEALGDIVSLELWEGGSCAISSDLLEG